jgi:hypothetical protein
MWITEIYGPHQRLVDVCGRLYRHEVADGLRAQELVE